MTPCHICTHGRRVLLRAECKLPTGTDAAHEPVLSWLERVGGEIGDAASGLPVGCLGLGRADVRRWSWGEPDHGGCPAYAPASEPVYAPTPVRGR